MKNSIVVIGTVFIDIKGYPFGTYLPTGRNAGRVVEVHGGVARNVAEDLANLELRPSFVGLVDDTDSGESVLRKLEKHKVNTRYIRQVPDGMGIWMVIFDNDGDVAGSISKRPDLTPIGDILDEYGDEIFSECDSIALEFDMEVPLIRRVLRFAEKYRKPVYALISNMTIALERRDLLRNTEVFVCNQQEAGQFFSENFEAEDTEALSEKLLSRIIPAKIRRMVVTLGSKGAVYADCSGNKGFVPAIPTQVVDTTGAGDSFFAGVCAGLTYNKTLEESCIIGTRLAASVIATCENVCPRFMPQEFGLPDVPLHSR